VFFENGHEDFPQVLSPSHPLVVAAAPVVIRAVEPPTREGLLNPDKKSFVVGVHAEGDVRLAAIAAEVSLADQEAQ